MAEAILRHRAEVRIRAASAGEFIADRVNPLALECLRANGIATEGLKTKAWGQFFGLNKPSVRLVIALCNVYAATANWPHDTQVARWNMVDPSDVVDGESEIRAVFEEVFGTLDRRIRQLLALPPEQLEGRVPVQELERIAQAC